jgi:hypothetical protein
LKHDQEKHGLAQAGLGTSFPEKLVPAKAGIVRRQTDGDQERFHLK